MEDEDDEGTHEPLPAFHESRTGNDIKRLSEIAASGFWGDGLEHFDIPLNCVKVFYFHISFLQQSKGQGEKAACTMYDNP